MASRMVNRMQALEKEVKTLHADIAIGASGAPTLTKGLGIASVTRDSAGVYDITLEDDYTRLLSVDVKQLVAASEDLAFQLESETVSTTKIIRIRAHAAGVETDPSSGSRLLVKIELKNSSVGE